MQIAFTMALQVLMRHLLKQMEFQQEVKCAWEVTAGMAVECPPDLQINNKSSLRSDQNYEAARSWFARPGCFKRIIKNKYP